MSDIMPDKELQPEIIDVTIRVTLKEHLIALEALESQKPPEERYPVPTLAELIKASGVSRATLYNMAGNYVNSANLVVLSAIMSDLRRRGFPTQVSDLLTAYPAKSANNSKRGK